MEFQGERAAERQHERRFSQTGHAFDEHVPAADNRQQDILNNILLSDDKLADFIPDAVKRVDEILGSLSGITLCQRHWRVLHRSSNRRRLHG